MTTKLNRCARDDARLDWLTAHVYECPECRELYWIKVGRGPRPTEKRVIGEYSAYLLAGRIRALQERLDHAWARVQALHQEQQATLPKPQARSA